MVCSRSVAIGLVGNPFVSAFSKLLTGDSRFPVGCDRISWKRELEVEQLEA